MSTIQLSPEELEAERKEILRRYKHLLKLLADKLSKEDRVNLRKAFELAAEAHKDMRRKSGEPYIYHPIAVAEIAIAEMGLGVTSAIGALLHDTVEDTYVTLDDIQKNFGPKVARIIDGLTKISTVFDQTTNASEQAENFRKVILTLSDDVRVILLKLADRLHNMRTLESMKREKQLKIASETLYLYSPLAHRLGLYNIKTELEDLSLKFIETEAYNEIQQKLKSSEEARKRFISRFSYPIRTALAEQGVKFEVKGRPKSVFSIYHKIVNKGIPFEEIYDIFAIRIILDVPLEREKSECWNVYSIITDFYTPSPDRLRDWISTPRTNGYESLHTTVMSPTGKWVEVQIRSKRMDEIAEKGVAAHWKYKEASGNSNHDNAIEAWLGRVREMLESPDGNAHEFIDNFKLNLFSEEIFLFTPKGKLVNLPAGATALDFAFEIHSQVGARCIGAKVNTKLVPLSYKLKSGDQVEIITSVKQKPKEDWLSFVITSKAKSHIKKSLQEEKKRIAKDGKEALERRFKNSKIVFSEENIDKIIKHFKMPSALELFYNLGIGKIEIKSISAILEHKTAVNIYEKATGKNEMLGKDAHKFIKKLKEDTLLIGDNMDKFDYSLAKCCNPIPGDEVFGFITISEGLKIHKTTCSNAVNLFSSYAYRVVKARWVSQQQIAFLAGINITGIDGVGLVNNITQIISSELNVNMRSISFDSTDGIFEGNITVYVHDTEHLKSLIDKLVRVEGVLKVSRVDYH